MQENPPKIGDITWPVSAETLTGSTSERDGLSRTKATAGPPCRGVSTYGKGKNVKSARVDGSQA